MTIKSYITKETSPILNQIKIMQYPLTWIDTVIHLIIDLGNPFISSKTAYLLKEYVKNDQNVQIYGGLNIISHAIKYNLNFENVRFCVSIL